jgi:2-dehydropantoate 2-reductase
MRILVFGAGAIGSMLGHRLSRAGHDVMLVGRPGYVQEVQARGLILEERGIVAAAYPRSVAHIEYLPASERAWDLILLTVKVYDTQAAVRTLAPFILQDTPLLLVQNGVGGEELAQEVLPEAALISGVITWPVSVLGPGHVALQSTRGGASLAPTRENQDITPWAMLLTAAGVKTVTCRDYRAQKWSKLLLNILANAVPAILDMSPGDVFADPALFEIERMAYLETLAVMHALRLQPVAFPDYPVPLLAWAMRSVPVPLLRPLLRRLVASGRGEKKPSLQIDLERRRERSEAQYLNGAVVQYAERLGLDALVNRAILDTLMGIATGQIAWDEYRGQPQKLVARVHSARGG